MNKLTPPALPKLSGVRSLIDDSQTNQVCGRIAAIRGDNVEVEGMSAALGAVCEITPLQSTQQTNQNSEPRLARVIGFNSDRIILSPLERLVSVAAGDRVQLIDNTYKVRVGPSLCGRVIDALGRPLDGQPLPHDLRAVDSQQPPPSALDRPPIDTPIQTGVRAIDSMITCGRGQRLGIFAGSGVGKSTLLGMLAKGTQADRIVIGMVGERGREVNEFMNRCLDAETRARSVIVLATSDTPAAQRVAAASTATAIAESFRDDGEHVLLLMDSVTRFAMAQREIGLAAGEPPTTRGYPPSVFNELPRLLERAGCTSKGSITAFYTVLVEGDDMNEPIADALRGLLDGHISLDRSLAAEAHWPPINVLDSVSRLQPHLVDDDVYQASSAARKLLSEYQRNKDLISIGAYQRGTDANVDKAIEMRGTLMDFLGQRIDEVSSLRESQQELISRVGSNAA